MDIMLADNSALLFTEAVPHTAGSVVIAAFPICFESGSPQYVEVSTRFLLTIFKEDAGNVFLRLKDTLHL